MQKGSEPKRPLRKRAQRLAQPPPTVFRLEPLTPFRLDLTVWVLRRRPGNLIDQWDGMTYRRALVLEGKPVEVAVTQTRSLEAPSINVSLAGIKPTTEQISSIRKALECLLGLKIDLTKFYQLAADDPKLGPLVERFRGVKPPRFPTLFEVLANAIACQQMSLSLGILLLSRLTERYGLPAHGTAGRVYAFPRPEEFAGLKPADFRKLRFSQQKGRAILALAQAFLREYVNPETYAALTNQSVVERLPELRGIGRWSAEYALLRGMGRIDVYPGDDVGAHNNLKRWLRLRKALDYERVQRITSRWQPYAGLVYFHLLLDRLASSGQLESA